MAVSFDEAWGDVVTSMPAPQIVPTTLGSQCSAANTAALASSKHHERRERRSGKRASASAESAVVDEINALHNLNQEIAALRQQLHQQCGVQKTVMYVSAAVLIVLLVIIAQAHAKLAHATECLLWFARKSG